MADDSWKYSPLNRRKWAIRTLVGAPSHFDMAGDKIIKWRLPEGGQPSDADVEAKVAEYKALWDAQQYARDRKAEYDALNQLEMQFDDKEDGTTTWEDAIKAIKTKYPKG